MKLWYKRNRYMNELIKKILNELNINEKNGLASNENYNT